VPYNVILISSFEFLNRNVFADNESIIFNKNDDHPFFIKLLMRFGASSLSLVLAQSLLYPLDTAKRCLQVNGSTGHKNIYSGSLLSCLINLYKEQGIVKGLYSGFSLNLLRCAPLTLI
jgi:hypothetical protein